MQAEMKHFSKASTSNPAGRPAAMAAAAQRRMADVFARDTASGLGAGVAQALTAARMTDLAERQSDEPHPEYAAFVRKPSVMMEPAARDVSSLRQNMTGPLMILLEMVGLLLLIACANISRLLSARSSARAREMALRLFDRRRPPPDGAVTAPQSLLLALCGRAPWVCCARGGAATPS